jgi:hypothetical protein
MARRTVDAERRNMPHTAMRSAVTSAGRSMKSRATLNRASRCERMPGMRHLRAGRCCRGTRGALLGKRRGDHTRTLAKKKALAQPSRYRVRCEEAMRGDLPFREALRATPPRGFTIPAGAGLECFCIALAGDKAPCEGSMLSSTLLGWHVAGQSPAYALRQRIYPF